MRAANKDSDSDSDFLILILSAKVPGGGGGGREVEGGEEGVHLASRLVGEWVHCVFRMFLRSTTPPVHFNFKHCH